MHSVLTHVNFVLLLFLSLAGTAVVPRQCLKAEDACSSNADPAVSLGSIYKLFGSVGSRRTQAKIVQGIQYILILQLQRLYKACSTFSDCSFRDCTRHAVHSQAAASETGCTTVAA